MIRSYMTGWVFGKYLFPQVNYNPLSEEAGILIALIIAPFIRLLVFFSPLIIICSLVYSGYIVVVEHYNSIRHNRQNIQNSVSRHQSIQKLTPNSEHILLRDSVISSMVRQGLSFSTPETDYYFGGILNTKYKDIYKDGKLSINRIRNDLSIHKDSRNDLITKATIGKPDHWWNTGHHYVSKEDNFIHGKFLPLIYKNLKTGTHVVNSRVNGKIEVMGNSVILPSNETYIHKWEQKGVPTIIDPLKLKDVIMQYRSHFDEDKFKYREYEYGIFTTTYKFPVVSKLYRLVEGKDQNTYTLPGGDKIFHFNFGRNDGFQYYEKITFDLEWTTADIGYPYPVINSNISNIKRILVFNK